MRKHVQALTIHVGAIGNKDHFRAFRFMNRKYIPHFEDLIFLGLDWAILATQGVGHTGTPVPDDKGRAGTLARWQSLEL